MAVAIHIQYKVVGEPHLKKFILDSRFISSKSIPISFEVLKELQVTFERQSKENFSCFDSSNSVFPSSSCL